MTSDLHKSLQVDARAYLLNRGYWICGLEVRMPAGVCDAWGISRRDDYKTMAIEVKVSRTDFRSNSHKFKESLPYALGNFQYVLCPEGLIRPEECHANWGLLWKVGDKIRTKKKAPELSMTGDDKIKTLIYFLQNGANDHRPLLPSLPENATLL